MPIFNTATEAQTWCQAHFPAASTIPVQHWWDITVNWPKVGFWAAVALAVYWVYREGLPAVWSDLKTDYATVRGWFAKKPVATATSAAA